MRSATRYAEKMSAAAKGILSEALESSAGNRTQAARALGVHLTHFHKLCKKHGVVMFESETTRRYKRRGRF